MIINEKKIKTSKRNTIIALVLLLVTNVLLSLTLMHMSKRALRDQMNQRMLDIANTAAYMLNGDELSEMTAEDEGTEPYNRALETLRAFQKNIQLDYIYGIKDMGDGTFTFTIDPDEDEPGEFGFPIETTEALIKASRGTPSVDLIAYEDRWGRFYSAYSPVYDSDGNIAGIVGVDFNADWYDGRLNSNRLATVGITGAALLIGVIISLIVISQNRKRFADTMKTIGELDKATERLDKTIIQQSKKKDSPNGENAVLKAIAENQNKKQNANNEYEELSLSLTSVYGKLKNYVEYIDSEVFVDHVTDVGNKASYKLHIDKIDEEIKSGIAKFGVAFFDINEIKKVYSNYGYEAADELMYDCARLIKKLFGEQGIYHITGDEFIAITTGDSQLDMDILLAKFENELKSYNSEQGRLHKLYVAKGASVYKPNKHNDYRQVFVEAKEKSDKDKAEYYEKKKRKQSDKEKN